MPAAQKIEEALARHEEEPESSTSREVPKQSEAAPDLTDFEEAVTSIDQQQREEPGGAD